MKYLKFSACMFICLVLVSCGEGDNYTISEFVEHATAAGYDMQPWELVEDTDVRKHFLVQPEDMYITIEIAADSKTADELEDENNRDLQAIAKAVLNGGPLCEMADNSQAWARGNLVLYVPLKFVLYYPEAEGLISLWKHSK